MLESLHVPALIARRNGIVEQSNRTADRYIGGARNGLNLVARHEGDRTRFRHYLARCAASTGPLIGALAVRSGGATVRFRCHGHLLDRNSETRRRLLLRLSPVGRSRLSALAKRVRLTTAEQRGRWSAQQERGTLYREHPMLLLATHLARQEERLHLSRELHDHAGQEIAAAILGLKACLRQVTDPGEAERMRGLIRQLQQTGERLHDLAVAMRQTDLSGMGLQEALAVEIDRWRHLCGIEVDLQCDADKLGTLRPEMQLAVFRVVREALTNIAKHAAATSVTVSLKIVGTLLRVTITDDGVGFVVDSLGARTERVGGGKLGIVGIEERIAHVGGTLEILSTPGAGTSICAKLPIW